MDLSTLQGALTGLPIGPIRYYDRIGSTNLEAANWADRGAPDMALVIADEQTAGKGRHDRKWLTIPKASLAFSLVLQHVESDASHHIIGYSDPEIISRMTALGSLAVSQALKKKYNIIAQIKWPNDVLLNGRKVGGVLAETHWQADLPKAVILGIGVNVDPESVPSRDDLIYPATCIQAALGQPISRLELLRSILEQVIELRNRVSQPEFLKVWEEQLAFRGKWVDIFISAGYENREVRRGLVLGLDNLGGLILRDQRGQEFTLHMGEIRLRLQEDR
jgi:BirA family biotin operon repressor/biotin-[acetyl-CoA-carboxylase] ligase